MRKYALISAVVMAAATAASAQPCSQAFLGTKTLYSAPGPSSAATQAYGEPVFVNYVGRHGARHLTKEVNTSYAWQLLHQADSAQALTAEGRWLEQMVERLDKVEHGQVKFISAEGKQELQGIGSRMAADYPALFKGHPQLSVSYTKEVRTQQSANAFLQGFKAQLRDSAVVTQRNDDTHLRFYDAAPAYTRFEKEGSWQQDMEKLENQVHIGAINRKFLNQSFSPTFVQKISAGQAGKFVSDIFGFATVVYSLQEEIQQAGFTAAQLNFGSLFTCDELEKLGLVDAADDYLKKGPGTDAGGLQVRIAAPLLADFINSSDEFIRTGKPAANLRFSHAETILPFAALLGISTADKVVPDLTKLNAGWQAGKIACLSANIQWVFYRDAKGGYKVKVLLNEREARITGLAAGRYPYYAWADLRRFYVEKLAQMGVKSGDDMTAYLSNVK